MKIAIAKDRNDAEFEQGPERKEMVPMSEAQMGAIEGGAVVFTTGYYAESAIAFA